MRSGRDATQRVARRTADRVVAVGLLAVLVAAGAVVSGVIAGVLAFRLSDLVDYAQAYTAFFVVAAALAVSALALIAGLAVAVGRRD